MDQARLQRRILLAGYPFDGPYPSPDDLDERPGVWVVLVGEDGSVWRPIDVGQATAVLATVRALHPGGSDAEHRLGFAASYDDSETSRAQIEGHVRARYELPRR